MAALIDIVKKGSTDRSVTIRIIDSTDGTPETSVVFDTSGIDLWYRREGATKTSITEADLATPALDDAHADGGFLHIGDGEYRLDLPDAAFATGANHVDVGGTVTGMVVIGGRVRLVDYDPEDTVRLGLTALPNAAADAAGGLPVSDAGGLDLDTKLAATNEVTAARMGALTDWIDGGRLDLILDARASQATADAIEADTQDIQTQIGAAGAGLTNINLPNQTMDITGNITGNLSGSVGSVTTVNDKTGYALTSGERTAIADAALLRDWTSVSEDSPAVARNLLNALRFLRNKWSLSGSTLTVTKEDDSTAAWTSTVTTTEAAEPITSSDPD
jgi:hypothetical protein